ncbi:MAG: hypothetical protein IPO81_03360 [Kouleothrix sp.]|nr:hypothetical protein [Kouleothrix sp.]
MNSLKLRSHVGADGVLNLRVPVGVTDTEVEVIVVFQMVEQVQTSKTPEELGWPPGFFERTAGSIPDFFEFDRYEGLDVSLDDDVVLDFEPIDDQRQTQ